MPPPVLRALTGLRFVAALHVLVGHLSSTFAQGWPPWAANFVRTGYIGVSLFFLLSGFILAYTQLDPEARRMRTQKCTFWVARFARIYPLYLIALIVALPILIKGVIEHSVALPVALQSVVLSPLLLQAWSPDAAVTWNMAAWTLSAETLFYISFPFVLSPLARLSQRALAIVGVTLLAAAGASASAQAAYAPSFVWQEALTHLPAVRILEFLIGVILGIGFAVHGWRVSGPATGFLLVVVAVLLCTLPSVAPKNLIGNALLVPAFGLLILALANGTGWTGRVLSTRTAVLLGESSYAVYLLHVPLYQYYNRATDIVAPGFAATLAGVFLFTIGLTVVAILTYRFIEVPARRQIRAAWERGQKRRAAVLAADLTFRASR